MRIDYFIVSEKLKDRVIQCEMHGHGIELEGKLSEKIPYHPLNQLKIETKEFPALLLFCKTL